MIFHQQAVFHGCKENPMRFVRSFRFHFSPLPLADRSDTRDKWSLARNPDNNYWNWHTAFLSLCPSPWLYGQNGQHKLADLRIAFPSIPFLSRFPFLFFNLSKEIFYLSTSTFVGINIRVLKRMPFHLTLSRMVNKTQYLYLLFDSFR